MMNVSASQRLIHSARQAARVILAGLITLFAAEGMLQLAFGQLPARIIERMPQYRERTGFRLETEHGAREYPAGQVVNYRIMVHSGDLFRLTCLPRDSAPAFEPYQVSFVRDNHGFRNAEPWPDDVELAVIGDSFVAAESVVKPFWQDLADKFLVLGLPGSGTLEQKSLLDAFALPRKPDTVVLAFFAGNDLSDNLKYSKMLKSGETFSTRTHQGKHLLDYSVLFNLALYLRDFVWKYDSQPCHYPQLTETAPSIPVAFYDEFLAIFALDSESLRNSEMFRATSESLSAAASATAAVDGDFVLMYIPQKAEVYWHALNDDSKANILARLGESLAIAGPHVIDRNLSVQRDLLKETAHNMGISFLDLTESLQTAADLGEHPYFFSDTHWNQVGHNVARIALLDFLNQSNLED